jgi:hypothetical protein
MLAGFGAGGQNRLSDIDVCRGRLSEPGECLHAYMRDGGATRDNPSDDIWKAFELA